MHEQNKAILKSLVSVAWADGTYGDEEKETIEALLAAFGASDDDAKELRDYAAEKKNIDDIPLTELSTDDRRVLLQHAVLLSFIDGEQHAAEKAHIDELCKKLRIPDEEAKELTTAAEARAKKFLNLL
jgi:tellurite resistance protein